MKIAQVVKARRWLRFSLHPLPGFGQFEEPAEADLGRSRGGGNGDRRKGTPCVTMRSKCFANIFSATIKTSDRKPFETTNQNLPIFLHLCDE